VRKGQVEGLSSGGVGLLGVWGSMGSLGELGDRLELREGQRI
jgi:hypothetical protein